MTVQGLALSQGWQAMRTKSQHGVRSQGAYLMPSALNAAGVNERMQHSRFPVALKHFRLLASTTFFHDLYVAFWWIPKINKSTGCGLSCVCDQVSLNPVGNSELQVLLMVL